VLLHAPHEARLAERSSGEQLHVASCVQRGDAGVEGHQADAVAPCQREELCVGYLPMASDGWDVGMGER